jgi:hypothetical protein
MTVNEIVSRLHRNYHIHNYRFLRNDLRRCRNLRTFTGRGVHFPRKYKWVGPFGTHVRVASVHT